MLTPLIFKGMQVPVEKFKALKKLYKTESAGKTVVQYFETFLSQRNGFMVVGSGEEGAELGEMKMELGFLK